MLHIEKWKVYTSLVLAFLGVIYATPNLMTETTRNWIAESLPAVMPHKAVSLGLDLQGGSHLLLQADTRPVIEERIDSMIDLVRRDFRREKIGFSSISAKRDGFTLRLDDVAQRNAALRIMRDAVPDADASVNNDGVATVTYSAQALDDIRAKLIEQSIEIVRRRVDESGTKEPVIQRQGTDRIVVQLPGIDDPERVKELIGKTAKMGFHLLDENASMAGVPRPGTMQVMSREERMPIVVRRRPVVSGDMLVDARPSYDMNQKPVVSFRFDAIGTRRFCDASANNVGQRFAIVLDNEAISAPRINEAICGPGQISGDFTVKEANDLALLLRAGALPAPLEFIEERSVGPTLGSDSVAAGKWAAVTALLLIFVLMAAAYGLFGVFANVALFFNVIFIFGILSLLQATLTLPGLAGLVLTIGLAVDANVLIYERIREELRQGRSILSAVDTGYKMAFNTIVDSNLTTLIVAIILFSFGSGPVKGFAVVMSIGVVTSMFSAIMLTRMMVVAWLRRTRPTELHL